MTFVTLSELPGGSFLHKYRQSQAYTDGFQLDVPFEVSMEAYIEAFYTTWLFGLERLVLAVLVRKPSSDAQVRALAHGQRAKFAAWNVEDRAGDQIIMRDYLSKTRSWLMCAPLPDGHGTRLYFGSAIMPERVRPDGRVQLGAGFRLLLPFHKVYSRALLKAAGRRLHKYTKP